MRETYGKLDCPDFTRGADYRDLGRPDCGGAAADSQAVAEIRRIAAREGESYRKVRARMEKDDLIDALAAEILERKAVDLIMDNAEFEEVALEESDKEAPKVHASEAQAVAGADADPASEEIPST